MQTRSRRSGNKLPQVWTVVPNPQDYQDRFYWQTWYEFLCTKPEMEARLGCPASNLEGGGTGKYRDFEDVEEDGARWCLTPACHAAEQALTCSVQPCLLPVCGSSTMGPARQPEPSCMQDGQRMMQGNVSFSIPVLHAACNPQTPHCRAPQ